jgi:hypothetical protein
MKFLGTFGSDFSGSLGGITASKNKGGGYLKARPNPVNPKTIAQIRARANMGASASGFSALTTLEVAHWNNYAQTLYIPKKSNNTGQYSGFQAYVSVNNQIMNAFGLSRVYELLNSGATMAGGQLNSFWHLSSNEPPTDNVVAQMKGITNDQLAMIPIKCPVHVDGKLEYEFQVGDGLGEDMLGTLFPDGSKMGFAVYMSNANNNEGRSYANQERYLMGYFQPTAAVDPNDMLAVTYLTLKATDTLNVANYNTWPQVGQWVVMSLYAVSENGNMIKIGAVEEQMLA